LARRHYKRGNELIRKKQFKRAIRSFRKALRANRQLALAHRGLGIAYAQLRQNRKACREYRIYLKMIPPDSKEVPALKKILEGCK
jgi:Flp pilus assembly protein TadD